MGMDHPDFYLRGFLDVLGPADVEVVSAYGALPEVTEQTTRRRRSLATTHAGVAA